MATSRLARPGPAQLTRSPFMLAGLPTNIALLRHSLCLNPRLAQRVALFATGRGKELLVLLLCPAARIECGAYCYRYRYMVQDLPERPVGSQRGS